MLLRNGPSWLRLKHALPICAAAGIGIALSFFAWFVVSMWENRLAKLEFTKIAENHALILQNGLDEYLSKIRAVRALFNASDGVSRQEFEAFAGEILQRQTAILRVTWIPRIERGTRAAHELAAKKEGPSQYHIQSFAADNRLAPSVERDEYFPVFYSSDRQTVVYGLDLASEPTRRSALDRARDDDQMVATLDLVLRVAGGNLHGFIVLLPVYRHGLPHATIEERRRNLAGCVNGVFQTNIMVETILAAARIPQGVELFLFSSETGANGLPAYAGASDRPAEPIEVKSPAALAAGPHWSGELKAGGASWTLVMAPMPGELRSVGHGRAWIVLAAGLMVSAAIVANMWSSHLASNRFIALAQMDSLTALPNRRAFFERVDFAFAASRRGARAFAVLYLDLDDFKDVNDTLGHPIGDALLRQVADRLRDAVRESDLVARFGGDEFAVLQMHVPDVEAAATLAAKIAKALGEPYAISGNDVHITASIGIARYSAQAAGPDAIIMQADLALYRAKEDGRNCFRFHSCELDRQVHERVTIADELRVALQRGELQLHYQPQVEIPSGRIVGVEALLRWNHPTRGPIAPSLFIPIAERTGGILALGQWVFEEACRQLSIWHAQGIAPSVVAVNVSGIQFKEAAGLERDVAESLAKWGIAPAPWSWS